MKHSILCVDDEVDNVDALERLLRRKYNVLKATSAAQALTVLAQHPVTVIISDQRMPGKTGVELLSESIATHPNAIRILLTGYTDIDSVVSAINNGQIYRYVTKPWDPIDLSNAIDKAVERFEIGAELVEKNRALQAALEELQTLDEAKNQFMVLVNHELKTPLTSILSFSDLLNETKLDEEQKRMLSRVGTAARRLQEMINDSLEFVSAETEQMKLDLKAIATADLFNEVSLPEVIRALARERGVKFAFDIESKKVLCDEKAIRNVFRRLIHNAVKFATQGTTIKVTGKSDSSGIFRTSIFNEGPAIDPKRIDQLMKPFTLNENMMNHSVGTGLGLSICQAMLKLHSASLEFQSSDGGVRVSFSLGLDPG
ncbi:MAG TPA: hybrid sensor histidine kinase/response regulator [Bdellovibrionales bacterium]|nr:hybrid sensor histidine kinase/response regulator [Bdellovibrionales bacterium]